MKEIKLTKRELKVLLARYSDGFKSTVERLVDVCRDLEHANEDDLYIIYNAFCKYLQVDGLCVYEMDEFSSLEFANNLEQKRLTDNVNLDAKYFAMSLYGLFIGYKSFSDLHGFLKYRVPLNLQAINDMLEYTFDDEED